MWGRGRLHYSRRDAGATGGRVGGEKLDSFRRVWRKRSQKYRFSEQRTNLGLLSRKAGMGVRWVCGRGQGSGVRGQGSGTRRQDRTVFWNCWVGETFLNFILHWRGQLGARGNRSQVIASARLRGGGRAGEKAGKFSTGKRCSDNLDPKFPQTLGWRQV